jgi:hypothetical protein
MTSASEWSLSSQVVTSRRSVCATTCGTTTSGSSANSSAKIDWDSASRR